MSFIWRPFSACGAGVGQQRHLAAVLHGHRYVALVLRAVAAHPPGADLAPIGDELPQEAGVLVVDIGDLLLAEDTDLLLDFARWWFRHQDAPDQVEVGGSEGWLVRGRSE